jgi:hypothetical protein
LGPGLRITWVRDFHFGSDAEEVEALVCKTSLNGFESRRYLHIVILVRGLVYGYYSMIGEIPTAAIAVGEILNAPILATIISQLWKIYHQGRSV